MGMVDGRSCLHGYGRICAIRIAFSIWSRFYMALYSIHVFFLAFFASCSLHMAGKAIFIGAGKHVWHGLRRWTHAVREGYPPCVCFIWLGRCGSIISLSLPAWGNRTVSLALSLLEWRLDRDFSVGARGTLYTSRGVPTICWILLVLLLVGEKGGRWNVFIILSISTLIVITPLTAEDVYPDTQVVHSYLKSPTVIRQRMNIGATDSRLLKVIYSSDLSVHHSHLSTAYVAGGNSSHSQSTLLLP